MSGVRHRCDLEYLYSLLRLRKDARYRHGLLQGFVSCGKIDNFEFDVLLHQVKALVAEPRMPDGLSGRNGDER